MFKNLLVLFYCITFTPKCFALAVANVSAELRTIVQNKIRKILLFLRRFVNSAHDDQFCARRILISLLKICLPCRVHWLDVFWDNVFQVMRGRTRVRFKVGVFRDDYQICIFDTQTLQTLPSHGVRVYVAGLVSFRFNHAMLSDEALAVSAARGARAGLRRRHGWQMVRPGGRSVAAVVSRDNLPSGFTATGPVWSNLSSCVRIGGRPSRSRTSAWRCRPDT